MEGKPFINLAGKVVIVTGASAGIGEAAALEFARQGCNLMLCGRDQQRLDNVVAKCREESGRKIEIHTTSGDIQEPTVQKIIIDNTISAFGSLDILVNNAGVMVVKDPLSTSREEYEHVMKVNMESVFFLTQLAVPHLKKTKGNIVNVSSIVSHCPVPKAVVYSMSKAAMDSYTTSLAVELAQFGIRVNSVNPGSVVSLLYLRGEEALSDDAYAEFQRKQAMPSMHPLGRMVLASEVADSIVFLASDRASFLTGQIIYVDGGRHCLGPTPTVC